MNRALGFLPLLLAVSVANTHACDERRSWLIVSAESGGNDYWAVIPLQPSDRWGELTTRIDDSKSLIQDGLVWTFAADQFPHGLSMSLECALRYRIDPVGLKEVPTNGVVIPILFDLIGRYIDNNDDFGLSIVLHEAMEELEVGEKGYLHNSVGIAVAKVDSERATSHLRHVAESLANSLGLKGQAKSDAELCSLWTEVLTHLGHKDPEVQILPLGGVFVVSKPPYWRAFFGSEEINSYHLGENLNATMVDQQ